LLDLLDLPHDAPLRTPWRMPPEWSAEVCHLEWEIS